MLIALVWAAVAVVLIPMAVWSAECLAALLPPRRTRLPDLERRPRVVVLVPAHDEAAVIAPTLEILLRQKRPGDRVVAIADNCADATPDIARRTGAEVIERRDPLRRGKSYALDYAVRSIGCRDVDVFVVIDADCTAQPGAVESIAALAFATGRPVQASHQLELPALPSTLQPLSALAFRIMNYVRPSGLRALHLPCFLTGSGMAIPAEIIQRVDLANGRIAEDCWMTVDLSLTGPTPIFFPQAMVTSRMPEQKQAAEQQGRRWLHGHLECMQRQGPRLLAAAIRQGRADLFGLLFDLWVPPLSLLLAAWTAVLCAAVAAGGFGSGWGPALWTAVGGLFMTLTFAAVLLRFGDKGVGRALFALPTWLAARIPILAGYASRRQKEWVRTPRD